MTAALNRYGIPLRPGESQTCPSPGRRRRHVDRSLCRPSARRLRDRRPFRGPGVAGEGPPPPARSGPSGGPASASRSAAGASRRRAAPAVPRRGNAEREVARHYRTAAPVVRRWLREAGIPVRPRTTREHRRRLDIDTVRELYQERGWTSAEIAARLGTHVNQVLRTLHDAGVPVRRGGPRPRRRPERPPLSLLASLYADPDIAAALRGHDVTPREHPGSIADRFPTPSPNRCCTRSTTTSACPPATSNCSPANSSSRSSTPCTSPPSPSATSPAAHPGSPDKPCDPACPGAGLPAASRRVPPLPSPAGLDRLPDQTRRRPAALSMPTTRSRGRQTGPLTTKRPAGGASMASAHAWVRQLRPGVLETIRFTTMATGSDDAVATGPRREPMGHRRSLHRETDFKIIPAQPSLRAPAPRGSRWSPVDLTEHPVPGVAA